ncbi:YdcF family protein [Telmatobacter bradus]|uniref:YdcF family protein n=1 Tax=Telmatobacter bradus TaxID=474953 RepID=UPI003B438666
MTVPRTRTRQSGKQYPGSSKLRLVPRSPGQRTYTRRWPRWVIGLSLGVLLAVASVFAWAILARKFAATSNTGRTHFDAILVLGYKADADGNPTPEMLARVNEAVREYERGVAPRLIVSGAAAHNQYVEAKVMARAAEAEGIPASSILIEDQAQDTIQNVCYSTRILKAHGWNSAEVISTASHLPRTAMILGNFPLEWRTHAAPLLSPDPAGGTLVREGIETFKTVRYLLAARPTGGCEP